MTRKPTTAKMKLDADVMSRCWKCNEDMDDDNDAHLIEAYETTGQIMCASCWEDHCERQHG